MATCASLAVGVLHAQSARTSITTIRGRVVDNTSGAPIPYARLQLSDASGSVRSDLDGAFSLEAGRGATIVISKAGYVRIERPVASLPANPDVRLARAAVLAGRVIDDYGQPIVGATVTASGQGIPPSIDLTAATDDRGEYRIGGLAAAHYRVAVQTAGVQNALSAAVLRAASDGAPMIAALRPTTTTTYFPDTVDASAAEHLALGPAEERHDIDFHVPMTLASRQPVMITTVVPSFVDARPPAADGATIRGVVTDSQSRPLPFAQVTLDGAGAGSTDTRTGAVFNTRAADERGAYEFSGLRPGWYWVRAAKPGYSQPRSDSSLPTSKSVGVTGPNEVHVSNVTLVPWGAISGRVRDEYGDPVQGLTISLLQSRYERGRRRLVSARVASRRTNDLGEFRIFAVPPGEYFVTAAADAAEPSVTGYARTFYPGTSSAGDARALSLDLGGEATGVEFALFATPTVRVSGTTFDAAGKPTTQLRLSLLSKTDPGASIDAHIDSDGRFEFENVPPGSYVLTGDAGRTNTFTEGEFVAMPVNIGAADVRDLRVQAAQGSTVTGRFTFDRYVRTSDPPPTAVTVTAAPDDYEVAPASIASTTGNAAGVFQLRGITGTRRLQVTRVPPRYMVKSILVSGRDMTDEAIPFGRANQSLDDIEVVLTDQVTRLTGTVTDGQKPLAGLHVLVFSTNRGQWYPLSRHQLHQTTTAEGTFSFTGLPAGSYFAVAVSALPAGADAWQDPSYLDQVSANATVIAVGDGDTSAVIVRP